MQPLRVPALFEFSRQRAAQFLLGSFFVVTVVAPAAPLNKLLFVALTLWLLADMLFARAPEVTIPTAPMAIFAIFVYGYVLSVFHRADAALALQFLLSVLILFQISFIERHQIDVEKLVRVSSNVMVLATILLWCAYFIPGMPMGGQILDFMRTYGLSAVGERDFFEDPTISLHLGTAPMLLVGFALHAKRFAAQRRISYLLLALVTLLGLLLSASRGLIAGAGLLAVILLWVHAPRRARWLLLFALLVAVGYGLQQLLAASTILSAEEVSNRGKLGHLQSFFEQLTASSLLFGRGLANWFYSVGADGMKADTEISPMDMVRYFGVPLTAVLYWFLLLPVQRWRSYGGSTRIDVIIFVVYVLLSFTNPILFNSMGMLVVLWYWSRVRQERVAPAMAVRA